MAVISLHCTCLIFFQNNYVNVHSLHLESGSRYYICVLANKTKLVFEKFTQYLDTVSECSNGITVDHTAPQAGEVWVGDHLYHRLFQVIHPMLIKYTFQLRVM